MGMPGPWELLIILAIVALLFGTKKLRNLGGDLGGAVKGFKNAMKDPDEKLEHQETSGNNDPITDNSTDNVGKQNGS